VVTLLGARRSRALELSVRGAEQRTHEQEVERGQSTDDPRRHEDEEDPAADDDEPLPGCVDPVPVHVAPVVGRDEEVPKRGRGEADRHAPENDGREEEDKADREREDEEVDDRSPGREVDERLEEPAEGPPLHRRRRRPRDRGAEQRSGDLPLRRLATRASQSVAARSGSPTTKTIRLRLVVPRVRKIVNQATPSGSATTA
jgi:hypothetical protein